METQQINQHELDTDMTAQEWLDALSEQMTDTEDVAVALGKGDVQSELELGFSPIERRIANAAPILASLAARETVDPTQLIPSVHGAETIAWAHQVNRGRVDAL